MPITKALTALFCIALLLSASVQGARAGEPPDRLRWYAGVGFGPARGAMWTSDPATFWDTGASPQVRLGRMIGRRFAVGLEAQTWFQEVGTAGDDVTLQIKLRVTGHLWALAGTWYPGPQDGFWSGFYTRAGVGPAISNFTLAIPDPADSTGAREIQERIDEWGWGLMWAVGYEAQVSRHFAAGVQFSSNHLWINEEIRRLWYGGPVLQLNWYF